MVTERPIDAKRQALGDPAVSERPKLAWKHRRGTPSDWRGADLGDGLRAEIRNGFGWWVIIIHGEGTASMPVAESGRLRNVTDAKRWVEEWRG